MGEGDLVHNQFESEIGVTGPVVLPSSSTAAKVTSFAQLSSTSNSNSGAVATGRRRGLIRPKSTYKSDP